MGFSLREDGLEGQPGHTGGIPMAAFLWDMPSAPKDQDCFHLYLCSALGSLGQARTVQLCGAIRTGCVDLAKPPPLWASEVPWEESIRGSQTANGISPGIHTEKKDTIQWAISNVIKSPRKILHLSTTWHGPGSVKGTISLI